MSKKIMINTLLSLALMLFVVSCKKSDQEQPQPKQTPPAGQKETPETGAAAVKTTPAVKTAAEEGKSILQKTFTEAESKAKEIVSTTTAAAKFTLSDQDGKTVNLSDFAGKIVVLEWTNPECPYVQRHYKARTMINLANSYRDKSVVWLAVNSTSHFNREKNLAWHSQQQLPYPILDDHNGTVGKVFGARTTPHMYVMDTKGNIAYQGAIDDDSSVDGSKTDPTVNYVKTVLDDLFSRENTPVSQTKPYGCSVKYAD